MLKVSCPQHDLAEMVSIVARGVSGRSTQPIQSNVLLEAKDGALRLAASDLEYLNIEGVLPADVVEEGATTVPADKLVEIMARLSNSDVRLTAKENHGLNITCGRAVFDLPGKPASDFSTLPPAAGAFSFEVPQSGLRKLLQRTVFATSRDESRPILTGALFRISTGQVEVVATDTYRLALQTMEAPVEMPESRSVILSRQALAEVLKIVGNSDEPITISLSDSQAEFSLPAVKLATRLIEGQFVNYGKVVPSGFQRRLVCDRQELAEALARSVIIAKDDNNRVVLRTDDGSLRITAEAPDRGEVEEIVSTKLEGEDIEIAFNARYMLDMLEIVDTAEVAMELSGQLNSGALKPVGDDSYLYVLMPMQIM
jgi:DNA polymerase-3 subunit beta